MEEAALKKIILQYLASHHTLTLATVQTGEPHSATLFYVNIGFKLYFLSSPASRHGVNLARTAPVSATINEDYARWRSIKGIQLEGTVRKLGGLWENGKLALAFTQKFPDVADFFSSPLQLGEEIIAKVKSVEFYELSPSRLLFLDNELGLSHRRLSQGECRARPYRTLRPHVFVRNLSFMSQP